MFKNDRPCCHILTNTPFLRRLEFGYSRSSGPGGQNVNKLNTKAEVRFNIPSADWLSADIRDRLQQYYPNKITKDGDLIVTSQEHRSVYCAARSLILILKLNPFTCAECKGRTERTVYLSSAK